ncbi:MAG: nucleotidyltransferase domain-containing protein [Planctomycetota bacterium]
MTRKPATARGLDDATLAEIVSRLTSALAPRAIYLFGSHAYGTPTPDSDVDLMIAVDEAELARDDTDERGYRALRGLFLPIELHIVGMQQFQRRAAVPASFEHEVRTKGKLLYAA